MSDEPRNNPGDFKPGNSMAFQRGDPRINRRGPKKKPPDLSNICDVGQRWFEHIAAGTEGPASREAMRAALREALLAGRSLPVDPSQKVLDDEVEHLFEKHFALVMVMRAGEKADVVRVKVIIDALDREYGKAQQSVEVKGGDERPRILTLLEALVVPMPTAPATKKETEA